MLPILLLAHPPETWMSLYFHSKKLSQNLYFNCENKKVQFCLYCKKKFR